MTNIYNQNLLHHRLQLNSLDLGKNIDQILLTRLRQDVEGKCIKEGYVRRDSVEVVERSLGKLDRSHFNGGINYDVVYKADICNPVPGMDIKCVVVSKNKAGAFCNVEDNDNPLQIFLATQKHYENKKFFLLKEGMKIKVRVLGRKFEYNDNHIIVSAILLSGEFEDQFVEEEFQESESTMPETEDDESEYEDDEEEETEQETERDDEDDDEEDDSIENEDDEDNFELDTEDDDEEEEEEVKPKSNRRLKMKK